jgi:MFS family permease
MTAKAHASADQHAPASAFAPLHHRAFAVLWTATVVGNIGGWVRDTGSAWLMTELAPSPVMVALVQAAATLPVFLFSLPAGALADILDRRRLMIVVQIGLACVSLTLGLLTAFGLIDPVALLILTLAAGFGAAIAGPVWQSIVPELVPRADLKPAVALNSLGINISRAIGPALAGALIVTSGVAATYFLDVASYLVTLAALFWWRRTQERPAVPEHFGGAMHAGLRYTMASMPLRRVLLRAVLFFAPASCYWALLPLIARTEINGGAGGYGLLLAAVGIGAVGGALLMPRLRRQLSAEAVTFGATLLTGFATAGLALAGSVGLGMALLGGAGAAWITMLTTLNGTAQSVLPNWVRGRGLAVYLTVFFGTMTVGSLAWGQVASLSSIDTALVAAGTLSGLSALLGRWLVLPAGDDDLTPSHHWPQPIIAQGLEPAGGPIMVTISYEVSPGDQPAFAQSATALRAIRRRDGAYDWGLMTDAAEPTQVTEWFLVGSWEEHLRQHDRIAVADKEIQDRVRAFHRGEEPPRVRHLVSIGSVTPAAALAHLAESDQRGAEVE